MNKPEKKHSKARTGHLLAKTIVVSFVLSLPIVLIAGLIWNGPWSSLENLFASWLKIMESLAIISATFYFACKASSRCRTVNLNKNGVEPSGQSDSCSKDSLPGQSDIAKKKGKENAV